MTPNLRDVYAPDRGLLTRILHDNHPALVAALTGGVMTALAVVVDARRAPGSRRSRGRGTSGASALVGLTAVAGTLAQKWIAQRFTRPEWEIQEYAMDHDGINAVPLTPDELGWRAT